MKSRDGRLKNGLRAVRNQKIFQNICGITKARYDAGVTKKIVAQTRQSMEGSMPQFTLETQLLPRQCR